MKSRYILNEKFPMTKPSEKILMFLVSEEMKKRLEKRDLFISITRDLSYDVYTCIDNRILSRALEIERLKHSPILYILDDINLDSKLVVTDALVDDSRLHDRKFLVLSAKNTIDMKDDSKGRPKNYFKRLIEGLVELSYPKLYTYEGKKQKLATGWDVSIHMNDYTGETVIFRMRIEINPSDSPVIEVGLPYRLPFEQYKELFSLLGVKVETEKEGEGSRIVELSIDDAIRLLENVDKVKSISMNFDTFTGPVKFVINGFVGSIDGNTKEEGGDITEKISSLFDQEVSFGSDGEINIAV